MQSQKQVWNAIAPEWYEYKTHPSKEVESFLKNQSQKFLTSNSFVKNAKRKAKILDLGSGAGRHLIKTKGKLYLVDFSEEMIKLAKKKAKKEKIDAEFFVADVSKLPFEDNFFDSAICISVFHCLETPKKREQAVKELYRVLKPKAQTRIGVWNKDSRRFKNAGKEKFVGWREKGKRYYYLFEEKEIHDLFKKTGFKIISTSNSEMMINFVVEK